MCRRDNKSIIPVTGLIDCARNWVDGLLSNCFFINTQLLFHGPCQWVSDSGTWAEVIVKLCLHGNISFLLLSWDVPVGVCLLFSHAPGFNAVLGATGSGYLWTDHAQAVLANSWWCWCYRLGHHWAKSSLDSQRLCKQLIFLVPFLCLFFFLLVFCSVGYSSALNQPFTLRNRHRQIPNYQLLPYLIR